MITPSAANAESHREISKTEYGCSSIIKVTEIKRFVTESFDRASKNSSEEIITITPDLTTETGNPVKVIYSSIKAISKSLRLRFPNPISVSSFESP